MMYVCATPAPTAQHSHIFMSVYESVGRRRTLLAVRCQSKQTNLKPANTAGDTRTYLSTKIKRRNENKVDKDLKERGLL